MPNVKSNSTSLDKNIYRIDVARSLSVTFLLKTYLDTKNQLDHLSLVVLFSFFIILIIIGRKIIKKSYAVPIILSRSPAEENTSIEMTFDGEDREKMKRATFKNSKNELQDMKIDVKSVNINCSRLLLFSDDETEDTFDDKKMAKKKAPVKTSRILRSKRRKGISLTAENLHYSQNRKEVSAGHKQKSRATRLR